MKPRRALDKRRLSATKLVLAVFIVVILVSAAFFVLNGSTGEISFPFLSKGGQKAATGASETQFSCSPEPAQKLGIKPDTSLSKFAVTSLKTETQNVAIKYRNYKTRQTGQQKTDLQNSLGSRKKYFVETMRSNPDSALLSLVSKDTRESLGGISKNCVETQATVEGTLEISHIDFFDDELSQMRYVLVSKDKRINVYPARGLRDSLESGTKVKITGFLVDNEMVFDASRPLSIPSMEGSGIQVIKKPSNPPVLGEQKIVVISAEFKNTVNDLGLDRISEVFNTVDSYYRENSYGKVSIKADLAGQREYTIPGDSGCDLLKLDSVVENAVSTVDEDMDFSKYSRLVIIAPFGTCTWAGAGTLGKIPVKTGDGTFDMSVSWLRSDYAFSERTTAHELGHNFGNHHATFLDCGNAVFGRECKQAEYGDIYDTMGRGFFAHFNAPHKEYLGWFSSGNIKQVTTGGTYTIEPIETATSGPKALKMLRYNDAISGESYMYVEYRQPIGFDKVFEQGEETDVTEGALVHFTPLLSYTGLLDAKPSPDPAGDNFKASVSPNSTFTDPNTLMRLEVLSTSPDKMTVSVRMGCTPKKFYPDFDGDGYGDKFIDIWGPYNLNGYRTYAYYCSTPPAGFVSNALDCWDNDRAISPAAPEVCDGKDNDCNGKVDDNIPDELGGATYPGPDKKYQTADDVYYKTLAGTKKNVGVCQIDEDASYVSCSGGKWKWNYTKTAVQYGWTYETEEGKTSTANCNDGHDNDCDRKLDCGSLDCSNRNAPVWSSGSGEYNNGVCNTFCANIAKQPDVCPQQGQGQGQGASGGGGYQVPGGEAVRPP